MEKLTKLKLSSFYQDELNQQEQGSLIGGGCLWCTCGCKYAGEQEDAYDSYYGGSSTADNKSTNSGGWFA